MRALKILIVGCTIVMGSPAPSQAQPPEWRPRERVAAEVPRGPTRSPGLISDLHETPTSRRQMSPTDVDEDGRSSPETIADRAPAIRTGNREENPVVDAAERGWWPQRPRAFRNAHRGPAQPVPLFGHRGQTAFRESFARFDGDGNGSISEDELPEVMRPLFPLMDEDGNQQLELSEVDHVEASIRSLPGGQSLLAAFTAGENPTPQAMERLKERLEQLHITFAHNQQQVQANRRSEWLSYLFTVGAMLASVVSFGHVISSPPPRSRWRDVDSSPAAKRRIIYSLIFITLLSVIDLAWTNMRTETSHFVEMNPLGSHILSEGSSPTWFKLLTLMFSVLLLFFLRRYRGAQIASWWMCLVCTLLIFRWIVLDSAVFS
jgi:hypothetical protein